MPPLVSSFTKRFAFEG